MQSFDLIVVGTGAGGLTAGAEAKKRGISVAFIEKDRPGGDCTYYGCVPTKILLHTAKIWHHMQRAEEYGLPPTGAALDFAKVMAHKHALVGEMSAHGSFVPWQERGFTVFNGQGTFQSPHEIEVNGEVVSGERIVIAVGTEPSAPPIEGLQNAGYLTNKSILELDRLPKHLVVLGAGPIGLEFSQMFRRFGAQVTVVEVLPQVLPKEDVEVAGLLRTYLEQEGIVIHTGAMAVRVQRQGDARLVTVKQGDQVFTVEGDALLVATGRRPATHGLGLEAAGVATERGWVKVDGTLRTTVPHIWGVGDCTGRFQFTHTADYQGRIVANNMFAAPGQERTSDESLVPWATFTDPELGRVGLTESEATAAGKAVRVSRMSFGDLERAHMMLERNGIIKVVAGEDGRILGASVLGPHGDELIHEFVVAMRAGLTTHELLTTIHAYPTLSEAVRWSMWGFEPEDSVGI